MHIKLSDGTEKRFIVQQCDSKVSKDQHRFCGRHERLQYRLQAENEFVLFPTFLNVKRDAAENMARPTSCLTVMHTQTFIHTLAIRVWPQYKSKCLATLY